MRLPQVRGLQPPQIPPSTPTKPAKPLDVIDKTCCACVADFAPTEPLPRPQTCQFVGGSAGPRTRPQRSPSTAATTQVGIYQSILAGLSQASMCTIRTTAWIGARAVTALYGEAVPPPMLACQHYPTPPCCTVSAESVPSVDAPAGPPAFFTYDFAPLDEARPDLKQAADTAMSLHREFGFGWCPCFVFPADARLEFSQRVAADAINHGDRPHVIVDLGSGNFLQLAQTITELLARGHRNVCAVAIDQHTANQEQIARFAAHAGNKFQAHVDVKHFASVEAYEQNRQKEPEQLRPDSFTCIDFESRFGACPRVAEKLAPVYWAEHLKQVNPQLSVHMALKRSAMANGMGEITNLELFEKATPHKFLNYRGAAGDGGQDRGAITHAGSLEKP